MRRPCAIALPGIPCGPLAASSPAVDRGIAQTTFDRIGEAIAAFESTAEVNPFSAKYDYVMAGNAEFTPEEKSWLRAVPEQKRRTATNATETEDRVRSRSSPTLQLPTWACPQTGEPPFL